MADIFQLPKPKRNKDCGLVERVRNSQCAICKSWPSDAHLVTFKYDGHNETGDNIMPLCRDHHIQWHQNGIGFMIQQHPKIADWLICHERLDVVFDRDNRTDDNDSCIDQRLFKHLIKRR